jgi:hypothetical protein
MRQNTSQTLGGSINSGQEFDVIRFDDDFSLRNNGGDHATAFIDSPARFAKISQRDNHPCNTRAETSEDKSQTTLDMRGGRFRYGKALPDNF